MNQGGGTSIKMNPTAVKGQMKGLLKGLRYISQMFGKSNLLFSQNFAYETSFFILRRIINIGHVVSKLSLYGRSRLSVKTNMH
jgi:hypothetical protein